MVDIVTNQMEGLVGLFDEALQESMKQRNTPIRDAILDGLGDQAAEFEKALHESGVSICALARVVNRRLVDRGCHVKASENTLRRWRKELDE